MSSELTRDLRQQAVAIFRAGIAAADPYQAIKKYLLTDGRQITLRLNPNNTNQVRMGDWPKVHIIAFGKAACAMAKAARDIIPPERSAGLGIAVTNYENVTSLENIEVIGAGHPLPDPAGFNAAKKCEERISHAQRGELVLVLVSGGGSALIPYPANDISLNDKITTTDLLLASGTTINQINCVRKHLSRIKGGGLAKMAIPADLHTFILSDVLGDDLSSIASGPTVPDNTTFTDAIEVFECKNIWHKVPASIRHHLEQGKAGIIPETPKPGDPAFNNATCTIVGSNHISVQAMLLTCKEFGYQTQVYDDKLCGEARNEAEKLVIYAKQLLESGLKKPLALLAGGETTVTLTGNGRGGRNQEMALAFAIAAEQHNLDGDWTFLSGGTDGRDGPTDAAGGIVDRCTIKRMKGAAALPLTLLNNNDSNAALKSSQDLLITGATGTNVADLQVLLIHPSSQ